MNYFLNNETGIHYFNFIETKSVHGVAQIIDTSSALIMWQKKKIEDKDKTQAQAQTQAQTMCGKQMRWKNWHNWKRVYL